MKSVCMMSGSESQQNARLNSAAYCPYLLFAFEFTKFVLCNFKQKTFVEVEAVEV